MFWKNLAFHGASSSVAFQQRASRVGAILRRDRHALATQLMESVASWQKYGRQIQSHQNDLDTYVKLEFYVFVDYLDRYFSTGDDTYKFLYIGEKLKQFCDSALTPGEDDANRLRVLAADIRVLCGHVRRELGNREAALLESLLLEVSEIVTQRGRKELQVLFFGDCLYLDVRGFLAPLALEDGFSHRPKFVASKNPAEQRNILRRMTDQRFDLIFYSPFTYEYSPQLATLHNWRQSLARRGTIRRTVSAVMDDVEQNLDVLAALYECPIYVHNTVNIRRHDSSVMELTKSALTRRTRHFARSEINCRLADLIAARRAADGNMILLDEVELFEKYGEFTLGRTIYATPIQHPAELGRLVAQHYREILATHADLVGKKVVVCDLDNTLWRGEIGEGKVDHFPGAQRTLKELRRKGVLLTVNSKNDARNVRWDGAELNEDDFVQMRINWDSKVANMRRIQESLNLKFKDFVFVDDRASERSMVKEAIPEIWVLDPTSDRAWKQLALWAAALPENPETDRTRQYREREQREEFIAATAPIFEDQTALFAKLELRVKIREGRTSELKRVAELINRTNQFNLAGSRTSPREISKWHVTPGKHVIAVEASDKFGPMGLICAILLDLTGPEILIPAFVLSCRAFGYGIENAVLSVLKRIASGGPGCDARAIRGIYRETPYNEPCRKMYPENGFSPDGDSWIIRHVEYQEAPSWLSVTDELSGALDRIDA